MRTSACLAALAALCAQGVARGQTPRLEPPPAPWIAQISLPGIAARPAPAFSLPLPADTRVIPPTYWLEGGLIGGVVVGLLGSQLCHLGDEPPPARCYVELFVFTGAAIGFPAGALIGGQFPKH